MINFLALPYPAYDGVVEEQSLLAKAMQLRGANGFILSVFIPGSEEDKKKREVARKRGLRYISAFDFEYKEYPNTDIEKYVRSEIIRETFEENAYLLPEYEKRRKELYSRGKWLVSVYMQVLKKYRITHCIIEHGIYLHCGLMLSCCQKRNVSCWAIGLSYNKGRRFFSLNASYHDSLPAEGKEVLDGFELTPEKRERIAFYLSDRGSTGNNSTYSLYNFTSSFVPSDKEIKQLLDPNKINIAIFPNVTWDANIHGQSVLFSGVIDWIIRTGYLASYDKVNLIYRAHPAETKFPLKSKDKVETILKMAGLFNKVKFIDPESSISSYNLASYCDLSLVYNSTIAYELVAMGNTVCCAGNARCRGKGFTIDPISIDEYTDILQGNFDKITDEQKELAIKYAYYYNYIRAIKYTAWEILVPGSLSNCKVLSDIDLGEDTLFNEINLICNCFTNKQDIRDYGG